uniref:tRNA-uridine aminocarboxypropyltransferase n=1 Tax=Corethron hystrix TaxID=216773 RepID=A0A7S1BV46_9STRA
MSVVVKKKRPICPKCGHHPSTCLCPYLPKEHPGTLRRSSIAILQHPHEARRFNSSVRLLSLVQEVTVLTGRRLDQIQGTDAKIWLERIRCGNVVLVYPSNDAVGLEEGVDEYRSRRKRIADGNFEGRGNDDGVVLFLFIDATWTHAKEMYQYHVRCGIFPPPPSGEKNGMIRVAMDPFRGWTPTQFRPSRFISIRCPASGSAKKF